MGAIKSHRDLVVWQKSMLLAGSAYDMAKKMPKTGQYGLTGQMLRAAVSIPANIAEGNARNTRKDYARFISIARGSTAELDTLLLLAVQTKVLKFEEVSSALDLADEIGRMLTALHQKLDPDPMTT